MESAEKNEESTPLRTRKPKKSAAKTAVRSVRVHTSIDKPAHKRKLPPDQSHIEKQPEVNLNEEPKKKKRWVLRIALTMVMLTIFTSAAFMYRVTFSSDGFFGASNVGVIEQVRGLISSDDKKIIGEENDRVNVLLIGYGGPGHDGGYLADTIILASIKPSTKEVALIAIPRDLQVNIPKYNWRKINNAFAFGRTKENPNGGADLLKQVASEFTGQQIPYSIAVDFTGFEKIIDTIGGVSVNVECGFIDREYPAANYAYQTVTFKTGEQTMNGATALKYARSRHGITTTKGCPSEGSDFARSQRQQKIIEATKAKAASNQTLLNPQKLLGIVNEVGTHASTDMQAWEFSRLVGITKDVDSSKIINRGISTDNLLVSANTPESGYYVYPKAGFGDFSEVQKFIADVFLPPAMPAETNTNAAVNQ